MRISGEEVLDTTEAGIVVYFSASMRASFPDTP